ncbi:MAG: VCBS repeat-containing protein, partial [Acidobacteria bacterium]|nr:VCBS repeat-containing protein [Acidobacteriota bacterium]
MRARTSMFAAVLLLVSWFGPDAEGGPAELTVVAVDPPAGGLAAPRTGAISVTFDRPVDPTSLLHRQSFWAFGRWSGTVAGDFEVSPDGHTVRLVPRAPLSAGERVMVILSHDLRAPDGSFLRAGGYSFQYWTAARSADLQFVEVDRFSTRTTAGQTSRAYGGIGSDVNGDGFLDVTIVNEDTQDLRVFLNQADGSGTFAPMVVPTAPVGAQASPSEPSDFDRDGNVDVAVANPSDSTVSVLLGNGDGSFQPQQVIPVGATPRGI